MTMVGFYVAGWREGEPRKTLFAFVCGAAAILTHYSAAPYVLFLALHYLFFVLPAGRGRPASWPPSRWPRGSSWRPGSSGRPPSTEAAR